MEQKPTVKGLMHPVLKSAAFAIALILIMLIAAYVNQDFGADWITGLADFLKMYIGVIAGFVFLISIWDYLYPFYKEKNFAKYSKPLIDSVGLAFGLWLVLEFIARLAYFVPDANASFLLGVGLEVFFKFFVWIFLLILFVYYAKVLLEDR